jgi:hypothetical protein
VGRTGRRYVYFVFELPANIPPGRIGNFIYARLDASGAWQALAVGHGALRDRTRGPGAGTGRVTAATHFHCHVSLAWDDRLAEAADLRAGLQAPRANGLVATGVTGLELSSFALEQEGRSLA